MKRDSSRRGAEAFNSEVDSHDVSDKLEDGNDLNDRGPASLDDGWD